MDLAKEYLNLKRKLFDKYYGDLNSKQREAIYAVNGPLLILAGAGSGKTTVLVRRIAHIIRYGNAYNSVEVPDEITDKDIEDINHAFDLSNDNLAEYLTKYSVDPAPAWSVLGITFTNKAAGEIKARITDIFGGESEETAEIFTGTFHSVCCRFLRKFGDRIGYDRSFSICDSSDSKSLISDCMNRLNIDEKNLAVKSVQNIISRAKDKLQTPEDLASEAGQDYKLKKVAEIYAAYQARLESQNLLDFDDIIMQTVRLLSEHDDVREKLQKRFKYVCVDEYQDTNYAQLKLTLLLSGEYRNIMVVGDDDQSIYKFRGAVIENILNFDKNYSDTAIIRLEENYRSTKTILDAANGIISNNKGRLGKTLWTQSEKGEPITVKELRDQIEEGKYICRTISDKCVKDGLSFKDFAVLYRMNVQSRAIEQALAKSAIPYRVLGGLRFFDRMEVKDIVSYLNVINNPLDDVRLKRIINTPRRGIGSKSFEVASVIAAAEGFSVLELLRNAKKYTAISAIAAKAMQDFSYLIDSLKEFSSSHSTSETIAKVIEATGYGDMIGNIPDKTEREERASNLEELISTAEQYDESAEEPTLSEFLEEVALVSDVDKYDECADAVVLMTIHSAKGLEFPVVFLPGMEEGVFPGYQTVMNPEEIEEERRLAYVAVTRAKKKVIISHVVNRMMNGKTQYNKISRFAEEIPSELTEVIEDKQNGSNIRNRSAFGAERNTGSSFPSYQPVSYYSPFSAKSSKNKPRESVEKFEIGESVLHSMFGKGVVLSAKEMGGDVLYEVVFDNHGTKKLMGTFAKLKKVN